MYNNFTSFPSNFTYFTLEIPEELQLLKITGRGRRGEGLYTLFLPFLSSSCYLLLSVFIDLYIHFFVLSPPVIVTVSVYSS